MMEKTNSDTTLVLAVHGVGDPGAGETVRTFSSLMAGDRVSTIPEVAWLDDPKQNDRYERRFPVHIRRCEFDGKETVFAELYWADVIRVKQGLLPTLVAFFRLAFGLRHAATAAASNCKGLGVWLGRLAGIVAKVLYGPVATLNLLLLTSAILCAALLYDGSLRADVIPAFRYADAHAAPSFFALGLVGLFIGFFARQRSSSDAWRTFFASLSISGAFVAFLPLFAHLALGSPVDRWLCKQVNCDVTSQIRGFPWFARVITEWLNWVWVLVAITLLVTFMIWFWARIRASKESRPSLDAAYLGAVLPVEMWPFIIPTFWVVATRNVPDKLIHPGFQDLFKAAVPILGVVWLMVAVIVLSFAITYAYRRWAIRRMQTHDDSAHPTPRLLVGPVVFLAVAFSSLVRASAILAVAVFIIASLLTSEDYGAGNVHKFVADYLGIELAITMALIVGTLLMSMRSVAAEALYMGLDIAEFFRATTTPASSLRESLKNRFGRVLGWLLTRENPSRVIIVTHSQGSVLAIDALADGKTSESLKPLTTELVTMGSPFSHLYQHYFPAWFPGLSHDRWRVLKTIVSRWHNIYRSDDYIGTEIKGRRVDYPQNIPIATGGHTGYWNDAQVRDQLEEILRLNEAVACCGLGLTKG